MNHFLFSFLTIASLHFLAVASPGPDFALVTKNSLQYSKRIAVLTALGVSLGIVVHASYCILGFALVIASSPLLFNILRFLGAFYLIYLGIKAFFAKDKPQAVGGEVVSTITGGQAVRQGFLCNLLNPKASLFFLGLFTLVIKPSTPWWERAFYGAWMVSVTFIWFSFIALLITNPQVRAKIWNIQPMITKLMGVLLVGFGVELIFFSYHPLH